MKLKLRLLAAANAAANADDSDSPRALLRLIRPYNLPPSSIEIRKALRISKVLKKPLPRAVELSFIICGNYINEHSHVLKRRLSSKSYYDPLDNGNFERGR